MKFGLACRSAVVMLPPKYTVEFCLQKISDTVQVISFLYLFNHSLKRIAAGLYLGFQFGFFYREVGTIIYPTYYLLYNILADLGNGVLYFFFEAKIKSLLQEFNFQKYRWHTDYNGGIISETVYLSISYMFHR